MRTRYVLLLVALAAGIAATLPGDAHGQDREAWRPASRSGIPRGSVLGILRYGTWECALPGDAGGEAFVPVPEESFRIGTSSSYRTADGGRGIYLLRGPNLLFTRGPKKDQRFVVKGENTLQKLNADGSESRLICTRVGSGV
ncbi:MAG: elongation factor P [Erythrobacter sp.]